METLIWDQHSLQLLWQLSQCRRTCRAKQQERREYNVKTFISRINTENSFILCKRREHEGVR